MDINIHIQQAPERWNMDLGTLKITSVGVWSFDVEYKSSSRLQKVGIRAWDDSSWRSCFSRLWGRRTVMLRVSPTFCLGFVVYTALAKTRIQGVLPGS